VIRFRFLKLLFVLLCCVTTERVHGDMGTYVKQGIPALGVLAGMGWVTWRVCKWAYTKEKVKYYCDTYAGPSAGFLMSIFVLGGLIVAGFGENPGKMGNLNSASPGKTEAEPSSKSEEFSLSARVGSGMLSLAGLYLAWHFLKFARPGIKFFYVGLLPLGVVFSTIAIGGRCIAASWIPVEKESKFLYKLTEKQPTIFKMSIGVAMIVAGIATGIVSYNYYWKPLRNS